MHVIVEDWVESLYPFPNSIYFAGGSYELTTDGTTETFRKYYSIAGQISCTRCLDRVARFVMTQGRSLRQIRPTPDRNP
jgi:hypothetical protein